jgi:hypothetical protein
MHDDEPTMIGRYRTQATTLTATSILGFVLSVPLGAAPLRGFSLRAESAHFSFYSKDRVKIDPARSEKQLAHVARLLGAPKPGRTDYYWYGSAGDVAAVVGTYAEGMAYPNHGRVHATEAARDHEIVHIVAALLGDPGTFFQEGLAVELGNKGRWRGRSVDDLARPLAGSMPFRALMQRYDPARSPEGYPLAGSFVKFLRKRFGLERVVAFFRACRSRSAVEQAFQASFGLALDEAAQAWTMGLLGRP